MPFLRFARDRRGYVSTFLMHTVGSGRGSRSQLLYWFRSPPSVQVGRPALDEATIASIEAAYPEVVFDWPDLLSQRPPAADAERWTNRRRRQVVPASKEAAGRRAARAASEAAVREEAKVAEPPAAEPAPNVEAQPEADPTSGSGSATADTPSADGPSAPGPLKRRRRSRRGGARRSRRRRVGSGQAEGDVAAPPVDGGGTAETGQPRAERVSDADPAPSGKAGPQTESED
ncbi:MAG: hypothetical protein CL476_01830 [Acidobacteria bacterium]|jgi:hypothetical protein|nr:hypothetical protein [Acidobacteriota bacterium]